MEDDAIRHGPVQEEGGVPEPDTVDYEETLEVDEVSVMMHQEQDSTTSNVGSPTYDSPISIDSMATHEPNPPTLPSQPLPNHARVQTDHLRLMPRFAYTYRDVESVNNGIEDWFGYEYTYMIERAWNKYLSVHHNGV